MSETKYVRHISGQGEKWEVLAGLDRGRASHIEDDEWGVYRSVDHRKGYLIFPKSEYRLVDPPEVWVDVTAECVFQLGDGMERAGVRHCGPGNAVLQMYPGYILRKVKLNKGFDDHWAFLVERRQP